MKSSTVRIGLAALALLWVAGCDQIAHRGTDGPASGGSGPVVPPIDVPGVDPDGKRTRYSFANQCVALKSEATQQYVAVSGTSYAVNAASADAAEGFYFKPSALGSYLFYNNARQLLSRGATGVSNLALASATDAAVFRVLGAGDATAYPPTPTYDLAMSIAAVNTYRDFVEPNVKAKLFTLTADNGQNLSVTGTALAFAAAAPGAAQQFTLETLPAARCKLFPEAQNNASGKPFKGKQADGSVFGFADTHVHVLSTTFLGGAKHGEPFHKFGVTHALDNCQTEHGPMGSKDALAAAFIGDTNGHNTIGYPTFPEWPSRNALTHEAIYWKWIERAWLGGLRVLVNDLVENGTLCELQRNASGRTSEPCNEMQSARDQLASMYAMQDYIDAQYGGRGEGWWRIVLDPAAARSVIADGKLAVVIGMEISNLFNCQLNYNPARQQEPFEEDGGETPTENRYLCTMTETGAPNEIKTQLDEFTDLGARQIISIHEFDNAFGGNGIFDGFILNLGNRENSGGNPTPGVPPNNPFDMATPSETPTGEFWTTYSCPQENVTPNFSGYLWENSGGNVMAMSGDAVAEGYPVGMPFPPGCQYTGQGGRAGGSTMCYPAGVSQCNARWMTPIGLYFFKELMEAGMLIDFDHITLDMKDQLMELGEAQMVDYPFISTHGTFGGTSNDQAIRTLAAGGHLYPSVGSAIGFINNMRETRGLWQQLPEATRLKFPFGFGLGTDTNGLSGQAGSRDEARRMADPVVYPFTLFRGPLFDLMPEFAALDDDGDASTPYVGVVFSQPEEFNEDGTRARAWHIDADGSAHYGMLADLVQEMRLEATRIARERSTGGSPAVVQTDGENIRDFYRSAETYLRTWERTLESQAAILGPDGEGTAITPADLLREAPTE